ncbi:hypothetical protein THRCLA_01064 [Thraustotheca clavata]|uniref:DUF3668 domain-containing protein n=1 Tax=Thraustotheca clavata TaxID=74557 RepID=A0A1W0A9B6_9STRA|nr:hypothetical protein THRCLA_01064 [Thraustotheca clavata]
MELEIHVRRARNLTFSASSIDPATLELRVQCAINGDLRSTGSGKRARDGFVWRGDSSSMRWYVTKADFHRLKSSRPTIKLYVFGIGSQVYTLGWFFLDLRTPDTAWRWVKILNSKYHGEVYVRSQITKAAHPPPATEEIPHNMLVEDKVEPEYLLVGPAESSHDLFLLTITLLNAHDMQPMVTRLFQKFTQKEVNAMVQAGFWLSYSLFDVLVQTDVFTSLDHANFQGIRNVFRLKSSVENLREFFGSISSLQIFLCTIDRILGRVEIPIQVITASFPVYLNEKYSFEPSSSTKGVPLGSIEIEIDLVMEEKQQVTIDTNEEHEDDKEQVILVEEETKRELYWVLEYLELRLTHLDDTNLTISSSSGSTCQTSQALLVENRGISFIWRDLFCMEVPPTDTFTISIASVALKLTLSPESNSTTLYLNESDVGKCFYHWTTEKPAPSISHNPPMVLLLKVVSIKCSNAIEYVRVECVPSFSSSLTISSSSVQVLAKHQVDIPGPPSIWRNIQKQHLLKPWQLNVYGDKLLGIAPLSLEYLTMLKQEKQCDLCGEAYDEKHKHPGHPITWTTYTAFDVYIPAIAIDSKETIGTLHVVCTLQDKYPIDPTLSPPDDMSPSLPEIDMNTSFSAQEDNILPSHDQVKPQAVQELRTNPKVVHREEYEIPVKQPRNEPVYNSQQSCFCATTQENAKAALAKEKKQLEQKTKELHATHSLRMQALETEWALREKERMQTVRTAQQEYMQLESQLRKTLGDLEHRERQLKHAEELAAHQHELQKQEIEALEKRLKRETAVTLQSMEVQTQRLKEELTAMENRAKRAENIASMLESDMATIRTELRKSPEHALRQEIARKEATIVNLEKQLQDAHQEKVKAEAVQRDLVQQVERLTLLLQQEKRKQEEEKTGEIEKLRLKYRAREERYVLNGDREELRAIKKQLELLREMQSAPTSSTLPEVVRLQAEKDDLLVRGGYSEESPIIQELDRRILQAKKSQLYYSRP